MTGRRAVVGGTAAVALLLLAACSTASDDAAAPLPGPSTSPGPSVAATADAATADAATAAPASAAPVTAVAPSLSASVVQYRRDAQRGVLQVKVTNDGEAPVHVTRVRLDSVTFAAPVEVATDSRIGPGISADLTVPLGEAACVGDVASPGAPADAPTDAPTGATAGAIEGATGDLDADGDAAHRVTLEVDGDGIELPVGGEALVPVAARRCAARAVTEQVDLVVAPGWADAGQVRGEPTLRGTVVATPQPGARGIGLTVEGATTLFTVTEPSAAQLPAGATQPVELDVRLSVTRCDPHAVAEDTLGYLLPVRVSLDGGQEVLVEVAVPVPERAPLQDLVDRTCGFP